MGRIILGLTLRQGVTCECSVLLATLVLLSGIVDNVLIVPTRLLRFDARCTPLVVPLSSVRGAW